MSPRSLIEETVGDLLAREGAAAAESGPGDAGDGWNDGLWARWTELGLASASAPEGLGGGGVSLHEACGILRVAAGKVPALPTAETDFLAGWLVSICGAEALAGPLTVAPVDLVEEPLVLREDADGGRLSGLASRVPWASRAARIVVLAEAADGPVAAVVPVADLRLVPRRTIAREPRADVHFDAVRPEAVLRLPAGFDPTELRLRGALARSMQMLGAMEEVLDMTVAYARDRRQFGRPISRFQAVQHHLAAIARNVELVRSAAEFAVDAAARDLDAALLPVAVAKSVASRAAGDVAERAHQVHAAIGFTRECDLHVFTGRLWEWREDFGGEAEWDLVIGQRAQASGDLWDFVTRLEVVR